MKVRWLIFIQFLDSPEIVKYVCQEFEMHDWDLLQLKGVRDSVDNRNWKSIFVSTRNVRTWGCTDIEKWENDG